MPANYTIIYHLLYKTYNVTTDSHNLAHLNSASAPVAISLTARAQLYVLNYGPHR